MSDNDVVHVETAVEFRMLQPHGEPDYIILRAKTQAGEVHNFGFDRAAFTHVVRVWAFDLGALEAAAEGRAPHPGKPVGSPDRKAS
jgi:hypothetical protein